MDFLYVLGVKVTTGCFCSVLVLISVGIVAATNIKKSKVFRSKVKAASYSKPFTELQLVDIRPVSNRKRSKCVSASRLI